MNKMKLMSLKDLSPEELRKWQLKLLEILVYFRDFCEEHDIKFFLSGGTCIGAIRHKGIIPWDDDVDVMLLREDYDKLISIWNKEADTSRFVCSVTTKDQSSRFPMATIRSVNTTCIYDHSVNDDICHGIKIDVEFLDVVPKGKVSRLIHTVSEGLMGMLRTQRIPKRQSLSRVIRSSLLLALFPTKGIRWKVSSFCEKIVTKYNPPKEDDNVRYLLCRLHPYHYFKDVEWVDFEGEKMPVVKNYDRFLRTVYGDYMQLPPEDQRKPATDNLVFYDLDHSYLDYKGKYYCVKK